MIKIVYLVLQNVLMHDNIIQSSLYFEANLLTTAFT